MTDRSGLDRWLEDSAWVDDVDDVGYDDAMTVRADVVEVSLAEQLAAIGTVLTDQMSQMVRAFSGLADDMKAAAATFDMTPLLQSTNTAAAVAVTIYATNTSGWPPYPWTVGRRGRWTDPQTGDRWRVGGRHQDRWVLCPRHGSRKWH